MRCNELREEIDELHRLIKENHGEDSVVASYIQQVKKKDMQIMERDGKLDNLQTKNALAEKEREVLKKQLNSSDSMSLIGLDKNEMEAELKRVIAQNAELKAQIEALTHVEAKLVANNKKQREARKSIILG